MALFPSINAESEFEAPEVQDHIKELVTGSTEGITVDTSVGTRVFVGDTMIHGDTGWRDITSDVEGVLEGQITIKRSSGSVWLHLLDVLFEDQGTDYTVILRMIPSGFRYGGTGFIFLPIGQRSSSRSAGPIRTDQYGHVRVMDSQNKLIDALVQWESGGVDSWPTSLPGTPF